MSTGKNSPHPSRSVNQQAAYWLMQLQSENRTAVIEKAFEAWRVEDPSHAVAFEIVQAAFNGAGNLSDDDDIKALRSRVLQQTFTGPGSRRWLHIATPVAATFLLAVVVSLFFYKQNSVDTADQERGMSATTFQTAVGEQSVITLVDGSTIGLNTDSDVRTHYSSEERRLVMLRGQAVFEVAPEADRPFVVYAGDKRVTALGTEFEIRIDGDDVAVTLIEGKVVVDAVVIGDVSGQQATAKSAVELKPGERLIARSEQPPTITRPDLERALSWREGRLIFRNEHLAAVLNEFNRYSVNKFEAMDPALLELRVTGIFKLNSINDFPTALTDVYPLESRTDEQAGKIYLRWAR